jgi:D-tyrosyl-tRNA(Tyr) deacylase
MPCAGIPFFRVFDYHTAMIAVVQRVAEAKVEVRGTVAGAIGPGLLVLLCAVKGDRPDDVDHLVRKVSQLRIFPDSEGRMNRSVLDLGGGVLVVSQFTLAASTRKGTRPSFDRAEDPDRARELVDLFTARLRATGLAVGTGVFGEMMAVSLVNDGPVTLILDSRRAPGD